MIKNFFIIISCIATIGCKEPTFENRCNYIDALGRSVSLSELTRDRGRGDAEAIASRGRVVFIGGYNSMREFTPLLRLPGTLHSQDWPGALLEREVQPVLEQRFVTTRLASRNTGAIYGDGSANAGRDRPDEACYKPRVIEYGDSFNSRMASIIGARGG